MNGPFLGLYPSVGLQRSLLRGLRPWLLVTSSFVRVRFPLAPNPLLAFLLMFNEPSDRALLGQLDISGQFRLSRKVSSVRQSDILGKPLAKVRGTEARILQRPYLSTPIRSRRVVRQSGSVDEKAARSTAALIATERENLPGQRN